MINYNFELFFYLMGAVGCVLYLSSSWTARSVKKAKNVVKTIWRTFNAK